MPAKSQAQARWARAGCPGSGMSAAKCGEFVPHGAGSMSKLPKRANVYMEALKRAKARKAR